MRNVLGFMFIIVCMITSCYDEDGECEHNYGYCDTTPDSTGSLTVKYTINPENPSITIKIYEGNISSGVQYGSSIIRSSGSSYSATVPIGDYSALVVYNYGTYMIDAIDADEVSVDSETYCEGTCYSVDNAELDCSFDEEAFKEYKSGDDAKCFIATAAYGSSFAPKVKVLREFRNTYLLSNEPGRAFVRWYYRVSPPIAGIIEKNSSLRMITRGILTPIVFVIEYPIVLAGFILLITVYLIRRTRLSSQ
jgi:hypothetical protein